jgi:hypothetical protein
MRRLGMMAALALVALPMPAVVFGACSSFDDVDATDDSGAGGGIDATGTPESGTLDTGGDGAVDVMSDPKNCGSLGHDCLGGACLAGRCQPVELHRGTADVPGGNAYERIYERSIAVDSSRVLWLLGPGDASKMASCTKTGCTASEPVLASLDGAAGSIVADDEGAYFAVLFSAAAGIYRSSPAGTTKLTGQVTYGADIRLAGDRIYIADRRDNAQNGGVHTLLRDGGSHARVAQKPSNLDIVRLDVGTDTVFVANPDRIYARALAAGEFDPLGEIIDVPQDCFGVVVDRANGILYWSDRKGVTIRRCSTANGGAGCTSGSTEISQGKLDGGEPMGLSFDGSRLYVVSDHAGSESRISSCDPSSCASTWTTHAKAPLVYGPPAMDATAIYWMELVAAVDAGPKTYRVMKVAK